MMAAKTSPKIRTEITRLWNAGGWTMAALSRKFGITIDTIHKIVDPEYAVRRQKAIAAAHKRNPPPSYGKHYGRDRKPSTPSLVKV